MLYVFDIKVSENKCLVLEETLLGLLSLTYS